jgi:cell division protein FtsX
LEDLDNFLGGITAPQKDANPMDDILSVKPVSVKSKAKMQATLRQQQQVAR